MKVEMFGEIVSDDLVWLYELFGIPCCCPKQVRDAIRELPEGEELILEINSPGGDVWAGFEIYGLLQACRGDTEAHIISLAASAATTVMCGADLVLASPVAQIMIHQPEAYIDEYLNSEGARHLKNFLDSIKASILNGYVIKSAGKATRKKFEELVDDSTWMPAQDAIALGLVDGFLDVDDEGAAAIGADSGLRISNAAGLSPAPKGLLDRYEAAVRAGTMAEVPGHPVSKKPSEAQEKPVAASLTNQADVDLLGDWHLMAAIDLERARG